MCVDRIYDNGNALTIRSRLHNDKPVFGLSSRSRVNTEFINTLDSWSHSDEKSDNGWRKMITFEREFIFENQKNHNFCFFIRCIRGVFLLWMCLIVCKILLSWTVLKTEFASNSGHECKCSFKCLPTTSILFQWLSFLNCIGSEFNSQELGGRLL